MRDRPDADTAIHSGSSASRAEPPPDARFRRVLGALVVLILVLGFAYKTLNGRPSTVPLGIAGLGLGMSPERAREAFGRLEEIAPDAAGIDPGSQLPRLRGRGKLFDEPATCTLWFAIEHTLSKIECALDPKATKDEQQKAGRRVLVTLQKLYGSEREGSLATANHVWQNQRALLSLRLPEDVGSIVLVNTSAGHDSAVTELVAARKGEAERQRVAEERDALKKQLDDLQKLERERRESADAGDDAGL
jgi:hypothetical protein